MSKPISNEGSLIEPFNQFWEPDAEDVTLFVIGFMFHPTLMSLARTFYRADYIHLEKYGKTVSASKYVKTSKGFIPKQLVEFIQSNPKIFPFCEPYLENTINPVLSCGRDFNWKNISLAEVHSLSTAMMEVDKEDDALPDLTNCSEVTMEEFTEGMEYREELLEHLKDPYP